ncbi:MAG: hypothetical protein JXB39_12465, partial [Deltaproteobacteria bacterium]|nr:hypothetical protein [Deltaproteobacteria bacterium]
MPPVEIRIGPFVLETRIARSPGCTLWRARRTEGRAHGPGTVVVRLLDEPTSPEHTARLQREYCRLGALGGSGAPEALALFAGHGALVRTWHAGETLDRVLEAREARSLDLDEATRLEVALGVARVLAVAHRASEPQVHGRIGPAEILLGRDGGVTLLGWGGWSPPAGPPAPEVERGRAPDAAADLWGLGVLLALLMEPGPWHAQGPGAAAAALGRRWPALGRLVEDLLAPDPGARPASMDHALSELLVASRTLGGVAAIGEAAVRAASPRLRIPTPVDLVGPSPPMVGPPPSEPKVPAPPRVPEPLLAPASPEPLLAPAPPEPLLAPAPPEPLLAPAPP